ncbi:MAG: helix-turn-helix domain-containing protein, partial [Clostridia bacterium]|nr:helix-turn-helix domain-containing protein [Clostridia bacterium]
MNKLSENLITLRKNNNLTQDGLAEKMYVSRQAVSKWERGESLPDIDTLVALSELYGVSVDDLLKSDLSDPKFSSSPADVDKTFSKLKSLRKKQNAKLMCVWAFLLLGSYALICGILQVALFDIEENIWIFWFTLPVVPPIIFAIRFRHEIGKKWIMFFINVPFIATMIFFMIAYAGN